MMLRQRILAVGLVIVGLSFAINLILMMYSTVAAFYLPWPRAWELLAGGCLACARPVAWNPRSSAIASIGGLAIILLAMFAFTTSTPFPG
jgi:peptidoglycan/LPS O-acetylase OafA/YrhL